jgi:hypothetical protein
MTLPAGYVSTWELARFRPRPRFIRDLDTPLTADEQRIIAWVGRDFGRPLTPQEVWLSIEQARAIDGSI